MGELDVSDVRCPSYDNDTQLLQYPSLRVPGYICAFGVVIHIADTVQRGYTLFQFNSRSWRWNGGAHGVAVVGTCICWRRWRRFPCIKGSSSWPQDTAYFGDRQNSEWAYPACCRGYINHYYSSECRLKRERSIYIP